MYTHLLLSKNSDKRRLSHTCKTILTYDLYMINFVWRKKNTSYIRNEFIPS